ncbi:MAG: hypothetical protein F6K04_24430 [Leptolyngbya sp. SIO4C5]|nr:hypothetical protein [Leptolyngbya sp. SIO4C5]
MLRDARDYQILFLSLFLVLGIALRDWTLRPEMVAIAAVTCLSTQGLLSLLQSRWLQPSSLNGGSAQPKASHLQLNWRSPLITALG